jgi:hypothetical protein
MVASLVQTPRGNQASGVSTISVGSGQSWATPAAGSKLYAVCGILSEVRVLAPTGGGWTLIHTVTSAGGGQTARIYEKEAAGTESTITATTNDAGTGNLNLHVYEVASLLDTSAFDVGTSPTGASAQISRTTGTSATLAQADELVIAVLMVNNAVTSPSIDSGFTLGPVTARMISAYKVVAATTPVSGLFQWTGSVFANAGLATFKGAVGVNATAAPSSVIGIGSVPAPTVSTGTTTAPSSVAGLGAVPAPTVSIGAVVAPIVVVGLAGIEPVGAEVDTTVTPATVEA